jgi:site-specific recombinase XerD
MEARRDDLADGTLKSQRYRIRAFVQWCEEEGITNLNDLTARSLHEYRLWRTEDGDLNTVTLRTQLSTVRVFVKFLESIDGVEMTRTPYLVDEAEEMLGIDGEGLVEYVCRKYGGDV